jgi:uncharacterized protein
MADRVQELRDFVATVDPNLQRFFPFVVEEVRDSGAGKGQYTVRGHASVYDQWSLDLGGFRERVLPGAFDNALTGDPHVLHLWDHDTRFVLSSTRNKTLELKSDTTGLAYWSRVAPTSYAADLRVLLERGDIDQSSFAFTVEKDEWRIVDEGGLEIVERSIVEVAELFDVTTCAMGAYPQTDSVLAVRSMANNKRRTPNVTVTEFYSTAANNNGGHIRAAVAPSTVGEAPDVVAEKGDVPAEQPTPAEPTPAVEEHATPEAVTELKALARAEFEAARSRYWKGTR